MLAILDLIPRPILFVALLALSTAYGVKFYEASNLKVQLAQEKEHVAILDKGIAEAAQRAAEQKADNERRLADSLAASRARERRLAADADNAKRALDELRMVINQTTGTYGLTAKGKPADAGASHASPLGDVLFACASRYYELAKAADGHVSDLQTLISAWPK